jgi:autotransporter adhesin
MSYKQSKTKPKSGKIEYIDLRNFGWTVFAFAGFYIAASPVVAAGLDGGSTPGNNNNIAYGFNTFAIGNNVSTPANPLPTSIQDVFVIGNRSEANGRQSLTLGSELLNLAPQSVLIGNGGIALDAASAGSVVFNPRGTTNLVGNRFTATSALRDSTGRLLDAYPSVLNSPDSFVFSSGGNSNFTVRNSAGAMSLGGGVLDAPNGIAIGTGSFVGFPGLTPTVAPVAVGNRAQALVSGAVALGTGTLAQAVDAIALGHNARVDGANGAALGPGSRVNSANGVALGANSVANAATVVTSAVVPTTSPAGTALTFSGFAGSQNVVSVVSVGGDGAGSTRQIVNLAPGAITQVSTNAVNGSQLFAVSQGLGNRINFVEQGFSTQVAAIGSQFSAATQGIGNRVTAVEQGLSNQVSSIGNQLVATNRRIDILAGGPPPFNNSVLNYVAPVTTGADAIAFGSSAIAGGNNSAAIGNSAIAGGADSTAVGNGATSSGDKASAFGTGSSASGGNSTAVGNATVAGGGLSTAVGSGAAAANDRASAFGSGALAGGANSTALGNGAIANSNNSSALGNTAVANGIGSIALGDGAIANGDNSAALGTNASSGGINSVALGSNSADGGRANVVSVGSPSNERQITNVAAGVNGTDAVNVNQVNQGFGAVNNSVNALRGEVLQNRRDANGGTAGAMAMAGMPQATVPGKSMVAAGASHYEGENAVAIGVSKVSESGQWVTKLNGTANTRGKVGVAVGVGFQW